MIESIRKKGIDVLIQIADRPESARLIKGIADRVNVDVHGQENVDVLRRHLEAGNSAIIIFNHLSLYDPLGVRRHLSLAGACFPTSIKYQDGRMQVLSSIAKYAEDVFGFEILYMIQGGDSEYSRSDQMLSTLNGLERMAEVLTTPGGVVAIAPEGTRSRTGRVVRAKSAWTKVYDCEGVREMALTFPVGIIGSQKVHRVGSLIVNPFAHVDINVGPPFLKDELLRDREVFGDPRIPIEDLAMIRIASLLPERLWGYYQRYEDFIRIKNLEIY